MEENLYENSLFNVSLVEFVDPVLGESVYGYGVFNTETGVREAETRRIYTAKLLADRFESDANPPQPMPAGSTLN